MRQIIHIDLDAFYANVEILLNPELKDKPLIVSMGMTSHHASDNSNTPYPKRRDDSSPTGRGVVATASYPARKFGVHSAMPLFEAMRLCPQAIIVPVRHHIYSEHSRRVMNLLREYSPLVEQVSIDEAYVEFAPEQDAVHIAQEIQRRIKNDFGLDCTIGVASNKLVSKIACNTVKPRGFIVVRAGEEQAFLAPLPIEKMPGAGRVTREKLQRWNVKTIGDLANVRVEDLRKAFGKHGAYLHEGALGQDDSPVVTERETKSISSENTFERDTRDVAQIEKELGKMSEDVARQIRREGFLARTVVLKLRYGDFTTITRQTTLRIPTADAAAIRDCVIRLFRAHWDQRRQLRLVGVGVHNFVEVEGARQLEFNDLDV